VIAFDLHQLNEEIAAYQKQHNWIAIIRCLSPYCHAEGILWNDPAALSTYGFALTQQRQLAKARKIYSRWIEIEPDRAQPFYCLGYVYYLEQNWKEAIRWFERALEIYPEYFVCLYRLGYALWSFRKPNKARVPLEKAVQIYESSEDEDWLKRNRKNYLKTRFVLGKVYLQLNRPQMALTEFDFVLQNDRKQVIEREFKYYACGKALAALEDWDAAIRMLRRALHPEHPRHFILDALGRVFHAKGDFEQAIQMFERALRVRRKAFILVNRARSFLSAGKPFLAIQDLNEALKRDSKSKHKVLLELGKVYYQMGKYDQAIHYAQQAARQKWRTYGSDYADAHYLLFLCYLKCEQKAEAQKELERAMALASHLPWDKELATLVQSEIPEIEEDEIIF